MASVRILVCGVVLPLGLLACSAPLPSSDAPAAPDGAHPDAIWFDVLAVSKEADLGDQIVLVQDAQELTALWERHGFAEPASVDFDEHVVLGLARSEDNCPDELVEGRVTGGVLETTWLPPPGGCEQPLIGTAWAVAFHRADLPESLTVLLREHPGHGGDKEETVTLPPYDGLPAPEPKSAPAAVTPRR